MTFRNKSFILVTLFTLCLCTAEFVLAQAPAPPPQCTDNNTVWGNIICTQGVVRVWRVSLALVDFIVVGGLIVAAFANIFRFKIDTYSIKQILPGLIIGIILANLSFFIMRLLLESATIFTQFIGNVVAGFTGDQIGDRHAAFFLMESARELLFKTLFVTPAWTTFQNAAVASGSGLVAAGVFFGWTTAVLATGAGLGVVLLLFLLLLFMLIPVILMLVLLFLLYIRNYILIFMFMISPIAFFALGFPPLRKVWQTWWGTFWKWLLMPIVAFGIIGLMVVFLNAAAIPDGAHRNPLDWFFFNGLAIIMLFMANRIPFMWGSVLGFNAMQKWAGLGAGGAKLAGKGIKGVGDYAYEKNTGRIAGAMRPLRESWLGKKYKADIAGKSGTELDLIARRTGVKRGKKDDGSPEDDNDLRRRIEETQVSKWNPIRGISGARQGLKARLEFWDSQEARRGRKTGYFPNLAGNEAAVRFYLQDDREQYNNIEAFDQAVDALNDVNQGRYGQPELEDLRRSGPTQIAEKRLPGGPFAELSPQEVADLYLAAGRVQNLGRSKSTVPKSTIRNMVMAMNKHYGITSTDPKDWWKPGNLAQPFLEEKYRDYIKSEFPYGGDVDEGEEPGPAGSGGGPGGTPSQPAPGGQSAGGGEAQSVRPEGAPDTTTATAASTAAHHQALQSLVTAAEEQYNIPVPTLDRIIKRVRRRMDARPGNRPDFGGQTEERVTYEDVTTELRQDGLPEITNEQWKAALPQLSSYSQNRKAVAQSLDRGETGNSGRFDQLSSASALAKTIAQNQTAQLPDLHEQMNRYAAELSQSNQPTLDRLKEVQADLGKIQPQIQISTSNANPTELQSTLLQSAERSRDAISLLQNETTQSALKSGADINNALKQTVRTEQLRDNVTVNVAGSVETVLKQQGGNLDAQAIQSIASKIVPDIQTLADFHPELQKMYEFNGAQQQQILNQTATEFAQHVAERVKSLPQGTNAIEHVMQPTERESLNQHLTNLVKSKIGSASATQSTPNTTPEVGSTLPPPETPEGNNP